MPATAPPSSIDARKRLLPWLVAVAFFMESLDTTILNTAVPAIAQRAPRGAAQHEVGADELHAEPRGLHSGQRLGGRTASARGACSPRRSASSRSARSSAGSRSDIHVLVACRILQGCGGAMMVPVGRLTMVRTFAKSELVRAMSFVAIPALIGPMLGPLAGGFIVGYLHWRVIFFVNVPIGLAGCTWSTAICPTTATESDAAARRRRAGALRLRRRAALVRARGVRRAHAERPRDPGPARASARRSSPATGCMRRAPRIPCCA